MSTQSTTHNDQAGANTSSSGQPSPSTDQSSASTSSSSSTTNFPEIELDLDSCPNSRFEYYGYGGNNCGYCKKNDPKSPGRKSHDMNAYKILPADYQDLLDRGWRRSGSYCYNPVNHSTCCPNYPIMCKALQFKMTRSHRKSVQKINSFLINGSTDGRHVKGLDYNQIPDYKQSDYLLNESNSVGNFDQIKASPKARDRRFVKSCERKVKVHNISLQEAINKVRTKALARSESEHYIGTLDDHLYPKIKQLSNQSNTTAQPFEVKHKLEIHLNQVNSKECESERDKKLCIMQAYQKVVHKELEDDWDMNRFSDFLIESPITIEYLKDFKHVKNDGSTVNYTVQDPLIDESEYFLVKPPELPTAYGTFHCSYHLDGQLIAVGVLDLLPNCLTTVYFFYDPAYGHLNLGIYSALVEISIVRRLNQLYCGPAGENKLVNYHLGYYVHECKKMHYKTRFRPSYLLCSETCQYVPIDICLKKLKDKKYSRFSIDPALENFSIFTADPSISTVLNVPLITPVLGHSKSIDYIIWLKSHLGPDYADLFIETFLLQYIRLVGETLIPRLKLQVNAIHRALVKRYEKYQEKETKLVTD